MSLSKSKDDSNREVLDSNSDTNEEDKNELCPGFKDVDAFVKVREQQQMLKFLAEAKALPTWLIKLLMNQWHIYFWVDVCNTYIAYNKTAFHVYWSCGFLYMRVQEINWKLSDSRWIMHFNGNFTNK